AVLALLRVPVLRALRVVRRHGLRILFPGLGILRPGRPLRRVVPALRLVRPFLLPDACVSLRGALDLCVAGTARERQGYEGAAGDVGDALHVSSRVSSGWEGGHREGGLKARTAASEPLTCGRRCAGPTVRRA